MNSPMDMGRQNLYGALESYEKSVRERKFKIVATEDKISHLKTSLEQARLKNQKLDLRCHQLCLETQMQEARFQTEIKKKNSLQDTVATLEEEYEECTEEVEKKNTLIAKIEDFRVSRMKTLKLIEGDFLERYKKIPAVGEYMRLCEEETLSVELIKSKEIEIVEKQNAIEKLTSESINTWKDFVNVCIRISEIWDSLRSKVNECEDLEKPVVEVQIDESMVLVPQNAVINQLNEEQKISMENSNLTKHMYLPKFRQRDLLSSTIKETTKSSLNETLQRLRSNRERFSSFTNETTASSGIKRYWDSLLASQLSKDDINLTVGPSKRATEERVGFSPIIAKLIETGQITLGPVTFKQNSGSQQKETNPVEKENSQPVATLIGNAPPMACLPMETETQTLKQNDFTKESVQATTNDTKTFGLPPCSPTKIKSQDEPKTIEQEEIDTEISAAPEELISLPPETHITIPKYVPDSSSKPSSKIIASAVFKVPARPRTPVNHNQVAHPKEKEFSFKASSSASVASVETSETNKPMDSFMKFGLNSFDCRGNEKESDEKNNNHQFPYAGMMNIFGEPTGPVPSTSQGTASSAMIFDFESMLFGGSSNNGDNQPLF